MLCAESGRLREADTLAADILELSTRHGLETARLSGTTHMVAVRGLMTLNDTDPDATALTEHIAALTASLDEWAARGVNLYRTYFDAVLAGLLIAAGEPEEARTRLDCALQLAEHTGMHYYDAELLRVRARTHNDTAARRADLAAARELARHQGAPLFELRAAIDDFEMRGESARAALLDAFGRLPIDCSLLEMKRAADLTSRTGLT